MRRKLLLLATAVVVIAGLAVPFGLTSTAATTVLQATADAYVKKGTTSNYSNSWLETLAAPAAGERWSLLKFNSPEAGSATLKLWQAKRSAGQVRLYATTNGWTETGVTWVNKPAVGALIGTVAAPAAAGYITFTVPSVVAGSNSFVLQSTDAVTNYQYTSREGAIFANRPTLTVTGTPPPPPAGDPRDPIFDAKNLLYGAQVGAWDMDGGLAVNNATAKANVIAAKVKVIRWQMWRPPCDLRPTNCQTTAQFNQALDGIISTGATPLIGLPPIWNEQCTTGPDPWSLAWQQWVISTAGNRVKLFELGNEPDNYCGLTGQSYHDQLWKPAAGGGAAALKKYARGLGHEIFIGGPAWANSYTGNLADIQTWLSATKADYLANGGDRDHLPDFVSTHTYLSTPTENDTQAHAQAAIDAWGTFYDSLHAFIQTEFAGLTDRGYPIADQLKIADSEYNDTIDNAWPGNTQAWADFYIPAMNSMFKAHHVWLGMEFTIASHGGGALDLLNTDGTAKPLYTAFKTTSLADPNNP